MLQQDLTFVVINLCFIITIDIVASTSKVTFTTSQPVGSMAEFLSFEAVGTFKIAISLITFRFGDSRHLISLTAILTELTDRTTSEIIKTTDSLHTRHRSTHIHLIRCNWLKLICHRLKAWLGYNLRLRIIQTI